MLSEHISYCDMTILRAPNGSKTAKDEEFNLSVPIESNSIQADFLFSYRPTPGTLLFLGYGSAMKEPSRFRFQSVERQSDGYFLKVSYLFK